MSGACRLAAILTAHVVGFSRLIAEDSAAALARLRGLRTETLVPLLAEHGGRLFKTTGDGFRAEFPSAVQALRCAIAIQTKQRAAPDALLSATASTRAT
jgi:class 3 adenylate cyclase